MMRLARLAFVVSVVALACVSFAQGGGGGAGGGRGGGGQRGMGGRPDPNGFNLLTRADVQTELKITDDQKTKITAAQQKARDAMTAARTDANGDQAAMAAAMTKIQEEAKKDYDAVLTADQKKRLHELNIQKNGVRSVLFPDVAKALGITSEQEGKIKDLVKTRDDANASLRQKQQSGEIDQTAARAERTKNEETLTTEIGKILTDDQKTKLTAMGGAAFKFATGNGGG